MNADRRSVDEDHAMDMRAWFCILISFLLVLSASGKPGDLKLCVVGNPKLKSTRTTKYCDLLGSSKRTPLSCVYANDRLECLQAVSRRKADFSVFEAEDLYFSTLWEESSVLVVAEIRDLKKKAFQYGIVAVVRKDANITGVEGLRGKRLCHPGMESGSGWNYLFGQYFEERVAPADCDGDLSVYEDRIKTTGSFFGSACKAGPWLPDPEEDARLKNKYWNLCALCDGGDCGVSDKYRGSGGSLICLKDEIGDVLWARHEDVKSHMKFLGSDYVDPASKYDYLCDDGTLMPLTSEEPCYWLAKPWKVIGANRKSATVVQKILDIFSETDQTDWKENLLHVIELYLEYIINLSVSKTPEDYLRRIPGYLSASTMSQGNCKPGHSVSLCVTSAVEEQKCDWMSKASAALGIQPSLQCLRRDNFTACLESVAKKETDVLSVPPDFFHDAAVKFNLRSFLLETGSRFNDSYFSSVVVKKTSGLKKLSDLKGKKVCLTRKNGIGWWGLLSALKRESLVGSSCEGFSGFLEKVCTVSGTKEENLDTCCSRFMDGKDEENVLRCLQKDICDAAILDFNSLLQYPEDRDPDLKLSDFRTICGNSERGADCHVMWSHPRFLMTSAEESTPKSVELFNVFFQLGQYFGRSSVKNNPMLEIFGDFDGVSNILFRDTSATFVASSKWDQPNGLEDVLEEMKACSRAPPQTVPSLSVLVVFPIFFLAHGATVDVFSRLRYGLVEPKTGKKLTVSDVFNNDSDSGDEQGSKWSKKIPQKEEKGMKKQTKLEIQRALQQDPTVYQYDEIFDEMTQKKQEVEQAKVNPEKKPKYIQNLMKTAERRKKENERRLERQIQKEREAEGDMYKDKEEFITSSYKAKLEEFKKAEEEEKKMEYIESIMDVTKQQDLGGFYRHLYKETVPDQNSGEKKQSERMEESCESDAVREAEAKPTETGKQQERNYRKRHNSDSNDGEEKKKQNLSSSSSDSDSSSDSSSTSSSSDEENNEAKESESKQNESKSGPEDGEIVERNVKTKKEEEEKPKTAPRNGKVETKTEPKEEKSKTASRSSKPEERERRDRNYRSSGYDRDRGRNQRRDDKSYRDRERERERERDRESRDDRKMRDRGERRSSDSRRRRSKTPDRRRNKSRERSSERSRSRRGQDRGREANVAKSSVEKNSNENDKGREARATKKEEVKVEEKKKAEEETKISIWEKRTVGAVFEAALERYRQRRAARGL